MVAVISIGQARTTVNRAKPTPVDRDGASARVAIGRVSAERQARNEAANRAARDRPADQRAIPGVPSPSASPTPRGR